MSTPTLDRNGLIKTLVPIAVYFLIVMLPTPEGLNAAGMRAFALVVSGIIVFSIQPISISIAVPFFVLLGVPLGIFNMNEAVSSFMGPAFIFVFAMVCIAIAFEKSGLTRRIALYMVTRSGGNPKKLLFYFIATAMLCSTVLADIPVLVMLYPICQRIIEANGCNIKGSNFAQSLLLGVGTGCFLGGIGTPAGSAANPTSLQILHDAIGVNVSFMEWACIGMPIVICLIPVVWLCTIWTLPSEIKELKGMDDLAREHRELGSLSRKERLFIIIFVATLILWFTDKFNGLPVTVTSMICVAVLALPGINIFNWQRDSSSMNWDAVMLVGGATAFGFMLTKTGVIAWFATNYLTSFASLPILWLLAAISVIMILSQFPIPAGAGAVATLAPAFLAVAQMKGIDPTGVLIVTAISEGAPILSPAICFYPIINASGLLRLPSVWKCGTPIAIAEVVLIVLSMSIFGKMLGFI